MTDERPDFSLEELRREGLLEPAGSAEADHDGTGRVELSFSVAATDRAEPTARSVRVPPGVTVFDAASWNGIAIDSTCGGHGTCRKCRVRIPPLVEARAHTPLVEERARPPLVEERSATPLVEERAKRASRNQPPITRHDERTFTAAELADGWRLACLVRATGDLAVDVPPLTTRPKAATVGVGRQVILRPAVQKRYVELAEPTLADQRTDLGRLRDAIDDLELTADLPLLRRLPGVLRSSDFKVTAVIVDEALIDVEPGDTSQSRHAIAFDLGTTTVVATLLDVETGTPVAVASMLNQQQPFGGDVITRISATMLDPGAMAKLRDAAAATLRELAAEVCAEGGVDPRQVYEVALAGNATMTALALGIDPEPLGVAPFVMTTASFPVFLAAELGLELHPQARAAVFPSLGAYVGGDIVAGMLATGMDRDKRVRLLIDVGTNCEIVLSDGDRILATAAPAGPAFEGGAIRCGMRAADGAIEVVRLSTDPQVEERAPASVSKPAVPQVEERAPASVSKPADPQVEERAPASVSKPAVELGVIGNVEPRGLCGSGLVDVVSELVRVGLLDSSGRFIPDEQAAIDVPSLADRLTKVGEERVFVLHRPHEGAPPEECVYLSQRDVRELQFAKAAISTGWTLLMEELGLRHDDVQQVLLAGSFGSYLSPASAVRIGLVPTLPVLRIVSAGNVAGEGAKMTLLSLRERAGAEALLREVTYVELSDRADFNDRFVEQLSF